MSPSNIPVELHTSGSLALPPLPNIPVTLYTVGEDGHRWESYRASQTILHYGSFGRRELTAPLIWGNSDDACRDDDGPYTLNCQVLVLEADGQRSSGGEESVLHYLYRQEIPLIVFYYPDEEEHAHQLVYYGYQPETTGPVPQQDWQHGGPATLRYHAYTDVHHLPVSILDILARHEAPLPITVPCDVRTQIVVTPPGLVLPEFQVASDHYDPDNWDELGDLQWITEENPLTGDEWVRQVTA